MQPVRGTSHQMLALWPQSTSLLQCMGSGGKGRERERKRERERERERDRDATTSVMGVACLGECNWWGDVAQWTV